VKKPSVEQVKAAWESMRSPTSRDVGDLLNSNGYKISYRTVARWKKNNWLGDGKTGKASLSEQQHAPGDVRKMVRSALQTMDQATVDEANKIAAEGGPAPAVTSAEDPAVQRSLDRLAELVPFSLTDLYGLHERTRVAMNIVMMEEAMRKANILTTIPKDLSHFVHSFTEASKASSSVTQPIEHPAEQPRNGSDAKLIEGTVIELSPLAKAIRAAKEKAMA
jgi:hypothetical protein